MWAAIVFATFLALVRAYPIVNGESEIVNLLLAAPAVIVLTLALSLSSNRRRSFVIVGICILVGWLLLPRNYLNWVKAPTGFAHRFRLFLLLYYPSWIFMLGSAITGAILDVLVAFAILKTKSRNA